MSKTLWTSALALLGGLLIAGCSSFRPAMDGVDGPPGYGCPQGFALARSGPGFPGCGPDLEALTAAAALAGSTRGCDPRVVICNPTGPGEPNLGAQNADRDLRLGTAGKETWRFCKPGETPKLNNCLCPSGTVSNGSGACEKESQAEQIERERRQVITGMRLLNERYKLGLVITEAPKP